MNKHTIVFEGKSHDVDLLLRQAGAAPVIEIDVSELAANFETVVQNVGAQDCGTILLFKHNGDYVPLQGAWVIHQLIAKGQTKISGKFVSKHLLKKVDVVATPLQVHNRMADRSMVESEDGYRQDHRPGDGFGTIGARMQRDDNEPPRRNRPLGLTEPRDNRYRRG